MRTYTDIKKEYSKQYLAILNSYRNELFQALKKINRADFNQYLKRTNAMVSNIRWVEVGGWCGDFLIGQTVRQTSSFHKLSFEKITEIFNLLEDYAISNPTRK